MIGHGWVTPNPDGSRARCGGPALCSKCAVEARSKVRPPAPPAQFPHCDQRVLHAPGECEYCDRHPDWQALRESWGIAFTGHAPETPAETPWLAQVPCPADFNRPPGSESDHRRWGGNVATSAKPVNETAASMLLYGAPGTTFADDFEITEEPVQSTTASPTPSQARWLTFRKRTS